jgi:predicted transport protein
MSSPEQAAQKMIDNLKANTGKDLSHWIKVVNKSGLGKHGEIVKMLKTDHGFTHGYATLVAHKAKQSDAGSSADDDLITAQYSGPKESLKPIYDSLMKEISKFGKDVELAPKKAYVSIRRKKQFAIIQPSTKTRVDVGINLKGTDPKGRLEESGSFNIMVSHRVKVENKSEVNKELIGWLKKAYEEAG